MTGLRDRDPLQLLDALVEAIGAYGTDVAQSPINELAPSSELIDRIRAVRAAIAGLLEHIDLAWGVIANAGDGDWSKESEQWRGAAERWRDRYIAGLGLEPASSMEGKLTLLASLTELSSNLMRSMVAEVEAGGEQLQGSPGEADRLRAELEDAPAVPLGGRYDRDGRRFRDHAADPCEHCGFPLAEHPIVRSGERLGTLTCNGELLEGEIERVRQQQELDAALVPHNVYLDATARAREEVDEQLRDQAELERGDANG